MKLYAKLAEVVQEVEGVAKSGKNTFHKYDYTTAEEMLRALRLPLAKRNVVLMPSLIDIGEREISTAKGGSSTITTVRIRFTLADGDTGETFACDWAGQGDDPADKGLGKAYTNAIKTFLREQFLIPQGDDPEADKKTDERGAERTTARSEQPTTVKSGDRPLNDEELKAMRTAIRDSGLHEALVLSSVGVEDVVMLSHARAIRAKLDAGVSAK